MNKNLYKKMKFIIVFFVIIFSLFSNLKVIAVTDDDGPDVKDSNIVWKLTCYSGENLGGTGFSESDFTTNEKYGWCEYEKDGVKYVVLAAATHELLNSGEVSATRNDKIHYFSYYDTVQFNFADKNFDSNTYNGIILDSCGASMDPTAYGHKSNEQILDVYFKSSTYSTKISGQQVELSMDGTFSSNAGKSNSTTKGKLLLELIQWGCQGFGNGIQRALNWAAGISKEDRKKLTYTRADIEADSELNEQIQVADAISDANNDEILNSKDYNVMKTINLKSTADNKKGQSETIYTADTEIPVIRTEFYSTSVTDMKILNINFFDKNNSSNSNSAWKVIRSIVASASHIVMYIAAALLLTMIIWRSIRFVHSSLRDNPEGAYESRQVMDNFIKSVLLIGFIYLIMAFLYYFCNQIIKILANGNESIYLLRVNVEGVYSFNTNVMGFLKYMTLNSDLHASAGYSFLYAFLEIFNLGWFGVMFVRMILIGVLVIIAPLTAVHSMSERGPEDGVRYGSIFNLRNFMNFYVRLIIIPVIMAAVQKAIMIVA